PPGPSLCEIRACPIKQPPSRLGNAGETGFQPIIIDITESAVRNIGCSMDDDIDTAKSFDRSINKCSAILMICNIGRKTFGISTGRDNFRFHFLDRKSTRLNSSHVKISYAVFCLKKKKN